MERLNNECYVERDCAECEQLDRCLALAVGRNALSDVIDFCEEEDC